MHGLGRISIKLALVVTVIAVLMSVVIFTGLAAGYCLHAVAPGVSLSSATIAGVLAFVAVLYCILELMRITLEKTADENTHEGVLSDEQAEYLADQITEAVLLKFSKSRRKRRRRRSDFQSQQ